jgi:hypothetical protein
MTSAEKRFPSLMRRHLGHFGTIGLLTICFLMTPDWLSEMNPVSETLQNLSKRLSIEELVRSSNTLENNLEI